MGFKVIIDKAEEIVKERKEISIAELSYKLDKSYGYVKYNVVPVLVKAKKCVDYKRWIDKVLPQHPIERVDEETLVWICKDGGGSE